jgi:hypothetical protein
VEATLDIREAHGDGLDALLLMEIPKVVLSELLLGGALGDTLLSLKVELLKFVVGNFQEVA